MKPLRLAPGRRRRQRGSYLIVFGLMLMPLMVLGAMAIDLSMAFVRRTELQSAADAAALAAARTLDGTATGIENADLRAGAIMNASFFGPTAMTWSSNALRFSDSADLNGNWLPGSAAKSVPNAARMRYARVDTARLHDRHGMMRTVFAGAIHSAFKTLNVSASAVAGRSQVQVTPLAICALDQQRFGAHSTPNGALESIEHGFRRGVNYNLLNLNPTGTTPLHFQVNPVDVPPATESASNRALEALRPMVCSGNMALPFLPDNTSVYVRKDFPASLATELNSRFGTVAGCDPLASPVDFNIKEYTVPTFWMELPAGPPAVTRIDGSARSHLDGNRLVTIAELSAAASMTNQMSYGPLWTFSKPLAYVSATGNSPATSGAEFSKTAWGNLYPVATGTVTAATSAATGVTIAPGDNDVLPYDSTLSAFRTAPSATGIRGRRILNIPLLSCPVTGGTATVLAVGRFLMTSRATSSPAAVFGEFGGLATPASLVSTTVLFR